MVVTLNPEDRRKLDELRRIKFLATAMLVFCFGTMIVAKLLEAGYPWLAAVAAAAEAATIGGLADWYAVVALFKRPMGLPIPHTAIIPRNQDRIADNMGLFIEENFLNEKEVGAKLKEFDFAAAMIDWLADRERSEGLARFFARLAPELLKAVDETELRQFIAERAVVQLRKTDMSPFVMEVMKELTKDGRHHRLLDEVLNALAKFLNNEEAVEAIRKRVAEELPTVLNIFRADSLILNRILKTATALLQEVREDADHDLRHEFEDFFKKYVRRLRRSKRFADRIERAKEQILDRPELGAVADRMWESLRDFVERDAVAEDSVLVARLTELFVDIAENLKAEERLRADINGGMVTAIAGFVEGQKSAVSGFIADQVKSWDFAQLTLLIEANVGRDLQFIRFNGMIIGGLAGLFLFAVERLLL
ncbi:MAG: DUF445 family protein [Pseudomonadota bacterium]